MVAEVEPPRARRAPCLVADPWPDCRVAAPPRVVDFAGRRRPVHDGGPVGRRHRRSHGDRRMRPCSRGGRRAAREPARRVTIAATLRWCVRCVSWMACPATPAVTIAAATTAAVFASSGAAAAFAVSTATMPPPPDANPGSASASRSATTAIGTRDPTVVSGARRARRTPRHIGQRRRWTFPARSSEPRSSAARVAEHPSAGSRPPTASTRLRRARPARPSTSPTVTPRASATSPVSSPSHSLRTNASRSDTGRPRRVRRAVRISSCTSAVCSTPLLPRAGRSHPPASPRQASSPSGAAAPCTRCVRSAGPRRAARTPPSRPRAPSAPRGTSPGLRPRRPPAGRADAMRSAARCDRGACTAPRSHGPRHAADVRNAPPPDEQGTGRIPDARSGGPPT